MADPYSPPRGQCRQCWAHAYDRSIHAAQDQRTDCAECVSHMGGRHPNHLIVK